MKMDLKGLAVLTVLLCFSGCTTLHNSSLDTDGTFIPVLFEGEIPLRGMKTQSHRGVTLYVFIEGDGHAWIRRTLPSLDPTPKQPIGRDIALNSFQHDALYLGRPCQYLDDLQRSACTQNDWTSGRFSTRLITIMNRAIDKEKEDGKYKRIVIGGYSGGGTMAMLIALRRNDVEEIITVASPLDTEAWSRYHGVSDLNDSRNPLKELNTLSRIKQRHYVGEKDRIVPADLAIRAVSNYEDRSRIRVIELKGMDHAMEGFKIPFSE